MSSQRGLPLSLCQTALCSTLCCSLAVHSVMFSAELHPTPQHQNGSKTILHVFLTCNSTLSMPDKRVCLLSAMMQRPRMLAYGGSALLQTYIQLLVQKESLGFEVRHIVFSYIPLGESESHDHTISYKDCPVTSQLPVQYITKEKHSLVDNYLCYSSIMTV